MQAATRGASRTALRSARDSREPRLRSRPFLGNSFRRDDAAIAPHLLRPEQCLVGCAQNRLGTIAVLWQDRDAHRKGDRSQLAAVLADLQAAHPLTDQLGALPGGLLRSIGHHQRKLISAVT